LKKDYDNYFSLDHKDLFMAIFDQNFDRLRSLWNKSFSDLALFAGLKPLHFAALVGNENMVTFLLAKGADIQAKDNLLFQPVDYAILSGNLSLVQLFVKKGANVLLPRNYVLRPIDLAIISGDIKMIDFLLSQGAKISESCSNMPWDEDKENHYDYFGYRCSMLSKKMETLAFLLEKTEEIHDSFSDEVEEMVEYAATIGDKNSLQFLLDKFPNFFLKKLASKGLKDSLGYVEMLFQNDYLKNIAFLAAVQRGNIECIELIIGLGFDINKKFHEGKTALYCAAEIGNIASMKYLVDHGADIFLSSDEGNSPLHVASSYFHVEAVHFLLQHGADVHAVNKNGETPFQMTLFFPSSAIRGALIRYGADPCQKDPFGKTMFEGYP
jgi:ankyrin repeat protein